jgi:hypothetical protein
VSRPKLADVNALPVLEPTVCGPLRCRRATLVSPLRATTAADV